MTRTAVRITALTSGVLLLTGCGFRGAYSFTLPGGADLGEDPYTVQVQFLDVLDLVPQSGVRVADVPVGRVEDIELGEDWTAVVTVVVNGDVELPANAVAAIQQSSLLGEKFVELAAPGGEEPQGTLDDGALITLDRTNRNVEVEELLGAMSLVLNGGGLAQLQTINRELGNAMEGRESELKDTLDQLDAFIGGLDEQRAEIQRALDSADALAATLAERTATIRDALDAIAPGLQVINEQRDLLVDMLEGLARLGEVGTRIIEQSAENTVEDLRLLQPILTQLAEAGPDLANALELMLTYPFPDSSLSALNYRKAQTGGYGLFTNMTATVDLDLTRLLCRYAIDPAGGQLKILEPAQTPEECGRPGSQGNPSGGQTGQDGDAQQAGGEGDGGSLVPLDPEAALGGGGESSDAVAGLPEIPGGRP